MRFETSNPALYEKYRPGHKLEERLKLINGLREIGYLVITGFLTGLPGETEADTFNDIELTNSLDPRCFLLARLSLIRGTPLKDAVSPSLESVLNTIARTRIRHPQSRILATTALETLDKENGAKAAFMAGANSLMINLTPEKYSDLYEIYPDRAGSDEDVRKRIEDILNLLVSIGRAPTDLGM